MISQCFCRSLPSLCMHLKLRWSESCGEFELTTHLCVTCVAAYF